MSRTKSKLLYNIYNIYIYIATSQITVEQLVYTIIYNTLSNYLVVCITNSDSFDRQARCTDLVRRFAASHGAA